MTRPRRSAGNCLRPLLATLADSTLDQKSRPDLWVDVLARLSLTAEVCAQPEAIRYLRQCGVRQTHTVSKNLSGEFEQMLQASQVLGQVITDDALRIRRRMLGARACSLDQELQELSYAYLRLLSDAGQEAASPFDDWLRQRAHMHMAQAEAIRRGI